MNNQQQNKKNMWRDGHHVNSQYWRNRKLLTPMLTPQLFEIALAMVLTDASMYFINKQACLKIEQGWQQIDFVDHLFSLFKAYCMQLAPWVRMNKDPNSPRYGKIKSHSFKTFSHATFTAIYELLYVNGRKTLPHGVITAHINALGLAYMCMADGSLQKSNAMVLHTQGFSKAENETLAAELNAKFGFAAVVQPHRKKSKLY